MSEKHLNHYLILVCGELVFFVLIFLFRYNRLILMLLAASASIYYFSWGIIHHMIEHRITTSIVLEYLFIGVFSFLLIFSVLMVS